MCFVDCEGQKVLRFHSRYIVVPRQMGADDKHMMCFGFNTWHFVEVLLKPQG